MSDAANVRVQRIAQVSIEGFDPRGRPTGSLVCPDATLLVRPVVLDAGSPGDVVEARLLRRRSGLWEAQRVRTLSFGPAAQSAPCAHFGVCGGCRWQETTDVAQLAAKRSSVERLLQAEGLVQEPTALVVEAVAAASSAHYRNRVEFSFGAVRWVLPGEPEGSDRSFALGLHPSGRFDRILDIEACHIAFPEAAQLLHAARSAARQLGASAHDPVRHEGLLRMLLLRKGVNTSEILVEIVSDGSDDGRVEAVAASMLQTCPWITTLIHAKSTATNDAVTEATERRILQGPGFIHEVIAGVRFRIQPRSFFQVNSAQAERLAQLVTDEALALGAQSVQDWCCGAGFFALVLARAGVPAVRGIELNASAVADARHNATANGLSAEFVAADIGTCAAECAAPDLIILDPPRSGVPAAALQAACVSTARKLIYIACDLRASVAQISTLVRHGWRLRRVVLVDQFPHTPHTEVVLVLQRD